jgi:hypothetical protein
VAHITPGSNYPTGLAVDCFALYNIPLSVAFHGASVLLDHSMMSRDMPLYMLDDTEVDTSVDGAPTALVNGGNDEKTQAHFGPGAVFSPMDMSMTHGDAHVTPPVQDVHVPLSPPAVDLAGAARRRARG